MLLIALAASSLVMSIAAAAPYAIRARRRPTFVAAIFAAAIMVGELALVAMPNRVGAQALIVCSLAFGFAAPLVYDGAFARVRASNRARRTLAS